MDDILLGRFLHLLLEKWKHAAKSSKSTEDSLEDTSKRVFLVNKIQEVMNGTGVGSSPEWPIIDRYPPGSSGKSIEMVLFEREDKTTTGPWYLLAIRGTRVGRLADIKDNFKIVRECLHESPRVDAAKKFLRKCIKKVQEDAKSFLSDENLKNLVEFVCVTGHSLGAATALNASRALALEDDVLVDTHVFNPPYASLEAILSMVASLQPEVVAARGLARLVGAEYLKTQLLKLLGVKLMAAEAVCPKIVKEDYEKFKRLEKKKWIPHLYLNSKDPICCMYLFHFRCDVTVDSTISKASSHSFLTAIRRKWFGDDHTNSFHLIPAGVLHVSREGNLGDVHSLKSWEDPKLRVEKTERNLVMSEES